MKLKILNYRPAAATEGMINAAGGIRRGSVILVDPLINYQHLKERTKGHTELIGVRIIGNSETTFDNPFELWTAYIGPYSKESIVFTKMLKKTKERKENPSPISRRFEH